MKHERIYLWEDRKDVFIDTYFPDFEEMIYGKEKAPAIIICPGGAFLYCSDGNEGDPIAISFMNAGYRAVVLNYTTVEASGEENTAFPAQLLDIGKAFLMVRDHAEEWGINKDHISVAGFSAGGNVAGLYATRWHDDILSKTFNRDSEEFRPFAALLLYGLLDYKAQYEYELQSPLKDVMIACLRALIGHYPPTEEDLIKVSPVYHVSEKTCPIFMAQASNDELVTPLNTLNMALALQKNKIPYELYIPQKGGHGFGPGHENGVAGYRKNEDQSVHDWLKMSQRWLLKLMVPELQDSDFTF